MKTTTCALAMLVVARCSSVFGATGGFGDWSVGDTNYIITGGVAGPTVTVTTASQFINAVQSNAPYVVQFQDTFDLGPANINVRSDKTILGLGTNATLIGDLRIRFATNVVVQNVFITNPNDAGENDGITCQFSESVWIDHCTFVDCGDGSADFTHAVDFVTLSYSKFFYTTNTGHNFVNLIGHNDTNTTEDLGRLRITFHHNWWSTLCIERMPRVRYGKIHSYNNYFNAPGNNHCIRASISSEVFAVKNVFENIDTPYEYFESNDASGNQIGKILAVSNATINCTGVEDFNDPVFTPPYAYTMDETNLVAGIVTNNAGAGVLPVAEFTGTPTGGTVPFAVTFTDTSTGLITDRFWDFGDGLTTNISATSVVHTYNAAGNYSPQLTVSGPAGTGSVTRADYISACHYILSTTNASFTLAGGTNTVSVVTGADPCPWTANSNDDWIELVTGGSGINTGDDAVVYNVLPNIGVARTGTVSIAGQIFTVDQEGDTEPPFVLFSAPASAIISNTIALDASATDNVVVVQVEFYRDDVLLDTDTTAPYAINFNTATVADGLHCFYAKAYDGAANVSSSSTNCATVDNHAPSVPLLEATSVSSNQINLSWSSSTDPGSGVAGYRVFRNGTEIATTAGTNHSDSALAGATEFCYNVAAFDNVGRVSAQSAEACAQTFTTVEALLGVYNGLVIPTNAPAHANSGAVKFTVSKTGSFAAKLAIGGGRLSFKGQFDASGNATNIVPRKGLNALQVILHLDLAGSDQILGTVSDGAFLSELLADRVAYSAANPCPFAGRYAVILEPPVGDDSTIPQGLGHGTLTVTTTGRGSLKGVLADGSKISTAVPLSKHGTWPLYKALYKNLGASLGWVAFDTNSTFEATVHWFKPPVPATPYFPAGFTIEAALTGNKYTARSPGGPNLTDNRQITLGGGNLGANIVKNVFVYETGNVVVLSPNSEDLLLKIQRATGQFSGSFMHPLLNKTIKFTGSFLQFDGDGGGYFLGLSTSGFVIIEPIDP